MFSRFVLFFILFFSFVFSIQAAMIPLYDDTQGNLPDQQSWLAYGANGSTTQSIISQGTHLVTSTSVSAGYSNYFFTLKNPAFPSLDRNQGIHLSFELQINSESHLSTDRAGFSATLLTNDNKGIELGFWEDEIWAQSDSPSLFTHGEGSAFDTTEKEVLYDLIISGLEYELKADGVSLLKGNLRDYSAHSSPIYSLPSFVFLGDNASTTQADINLGAVTLTTVPLPASWILFLFGISGFKLISSKKHR